MFEVVQGHQIIHYTKVFKASLRVFWFSGGDCYLKGEPQKCEKIDSSPLCRILTMLEICQIVFWYPHCSLDGKSFCTLTTVHMFLDAEIVIFVQGCLSIN